MSDAEELAAGLDALTADERARWVVRSLDHIDGKSMHPPWMSPGTPEAKASAAREAHQERCEAVSVQCRCLKAPHPEEEPHVCEHGRWGGQRIIRDRTYHGGVRDERERILGIIEERRQRILKAAEGVSPEYRRVWLLRAEDLSTLAFVIKGES